MNRSAHSRLFRWCVGIAAIMAAIVQPVVGRTQTPTNGLIMLLEFERIEGLRHWEQELDKRHLTALVQVQSNILQKFSADMRAPRQLVLAVPVAPTQSLAELRSEADAVVCLEDYDDFGAIGLYYADFGQISDA